MKSKLHKSTGQDDVEYKYCDVLWLAERGGYLKHMTIVHLAPFVQLTCSLEPEMDPEQKLEINVFKHKYVDLLRFDNLA